jgi:hypothetical protein
MAVGIRHADQVAPSIRKKLALTSRASGGLSVRNVLSRTKTSDLLLVFIMMLLRLVLDSSLYYNL